MYILDCLFDLFIYLYVIVNLVSVAVLRINNVISLQPIAADCWI